jgi:hypothetical protein
MYTHTVSAWKATLWTFVGALGLIVPIIALAGPNDLILLEPVPGGPSTIPASSTSQLGAFFIYFNQGIWPWAFGVGVGIAVLNCTIGGLQMVLSNGDTGKVDAGKTRFMWATLGLLMLFLAGTILSFINPQGFVS